MYSLLDMFISNNLKGSGFPLPSTDPPSDDSSNKNAIIFGQSMVHFTGDSLGERQLRGGGRGMAEWQREKQAQRQTVQASSAE
ncbi:hypothetical protein KUCAC02_003798 [Chaenocephalus aceratus]|uniref:Uncharacterized protein n=1 Tax=Chaenocephalus aceratus TaxID=36190 RepID=A0ACB9WLP6_CHAAC|nr:hypothetical protein KUCAC02_003798 [Chaenocephalus aceratus]